MRARRVLAILGKDLRDALRDGRILILIALPIAIAVFYDATTKDEDALPATKAAIVDPADQGVADALRRGAGRSVEVKVTTAPDAAAARRLVAAGDVAFAVVAPAPRSPSAATERPQVFVGQNASPVAQSVIALVPDALTRAAGGEPPAQMRVRAVAATDRAPYEVIEQRELSVLIMIVVLVTGVAMLVVPIQTAEEIETGTFGALRLAASGPEILAAKALSGCIYGAGSVALTVLVTGLAVQSPWLFAGAALAFVVSLVAFGLLLGLLIPNSNAINTYGAYFLIPLVGLSLAAFFVQSGALATVLDFLPFSQAARLLGDGLGSESQLDAEPMAWVVIAAWTVGGFAILARIASRREL